MAKVEVVTSEAVHQHSLFSNLVTVTVVIVDPVHEIDLPGVDHHRPSLVSVLDRYFLGMFLIYLFFHS